MNSEKYWSAIASKTVTGQYGSSTVSQQVNVQSGCYTLLCIMGSWSTDSWDGCVVPNLGDVRRCKNITAVCTWLHTIVLHNAAQNSSDNLHLIHQTIIIAQMSYGGEEHLMFGILPFLDIFNFVCQNATTDDYIFLKKCPWDDTRAAIRRRVHILNLPPAWSMGQWPCIALDIETTVH